MKRYICATLVVAVVLGVFSVAALAEKDPRGDRIRQRVQARCEKFIEELKLSPEKQEQVRQILETHQQAVANWRQEHGEDFRGLAGQHRGAMKAGEKEKAKGFRKQMRKLGEGRKKLREELMKQLADVLTEEQMVKAKEMLDRAHRRGARFAAALWALDLTEQQKEKAKAILDAARQEAEKVEGGEERAKIFKPAFEKIRKEVLTDEQRQRLKTMKRRAGARGAFAELNLSDEQKARIQDIRKAAHRKIVEEVLTDEQRQQLREHRKQHRKGKGRSGKE